MHHLGKILVVDDSECDRELLNHNLTRQGMTVIEAASHATCLEALEKHKDIKLILLDLNLARESGANTLSIIREKYNKIDLPVVMLSGTHDTSSIVHCLQLGANDYVTKPFDFSVLFTRIKTQLSVSFLSSEITKNKEQTSLSILINTYNHEINNPLFIALALAEVMKKNGSTNFQHLQDLEESLWRVSDIVKKISQIVNNKEEWNIIPYSAQSNIIKLP